MVCECIVTISSPEQFLQHVKGTGNHLMVCVFTAEWAPQSKQVLDALSVFCKNKGLGSVKYFQADSESLSQICQEHGITSIPSTILIAKELKVAVVEGADVTTLKNTIQDEAAKAFPNSVTDFPPDETSKPSLEDRLKSLVNKSRVMLFIKGTRQVPRCGFTRQLIDIMDQTGVEYETFDILSDEEVRQGLKSYSNWPTYPQVYVKGNLVGGLDIIRELIEVGELEETLKG